MRPGKAQIAAGLMVLLVAPLSPERLSADSAAPALLTVTGQIAQPPVSLTRADLEALPQHRLVTATTVTDGTPAFEGFLMRDLLAQLGAEGAEVIARALNDYRVAIPLSDFHNYDVIGALSMNGETLSPRDKGPIWIVYPRDDHRALQDIRYDTRWVWQLHTLHVQ